MSTTISMWLGVVFVVTGLAAVVLQAWLWSFPMVPDPGGPDPNGKSTAPPFWTGVHRVLGLVYVVIYVVMMWFMVPRLWEYQFELPARTVVHTCMAITIGVLLMTKIAIIRWFQHFGKALPAIGFGLGLCTVLLAVLSLPHAFRAHALSIDAFSDRNIERVERLLDKVEDLQDPATGQAMAAGWVSQGVLEQGRTILTGKCAVCHDMRTILIRPRTPDGWHRVVERMLDKPNLGPPLLPQDIAPVTAYLVAITPDLQASKKRKRQQQKAREAVVGPNVAQAAPVPAPGGEMASAEDSTGEAKPKTAALPEGYDKEAVTELVEDECTACHEMDECEEHGGDDVAGWHEVVERMVKDEGAELSPEQMLWVSHWLAEAYPKEAGD